MRCCAVLGVALAGMLMPSVLSAVPCAFRAHSGRENAEDRCADQIYKLGPVLQNHPAIAAICDDLPDLMHLAQGGDWTHIAKRQRLGVGRSILAIRCRQVAYNGQWLLFAMEDRGQALPKLMLFPTVPQPGQPDFTFAVDMRELVKGRVYDYRKMLGDGSGGAYAEYRIHAKDLRPVLQMAIVKPDADHQGSYHFQLGRRPQGTGWRQAAVPDQPFGCLIDLADLTDPPTCGSKHP